MEKSNQSYKIGMSAFGLIFFIFGFATTFIITLSAPVKQIFELSEFEAQLLTAAFFITYPILSIPTGYLINKIGYKTTLVTGLILMGIGSFMFFPAASEKVFGLFLVATFVLASGVVFLQTAANPYVVSLGSEETASGRLNLTQALNSIATMVAPWLIGVAIFKGLKLVDGIKLKELKLTDTDAYDAAIQQAGIAAERVPMPFIIMGVVVLIVAVGIIILKLPKVESKKSEGERKSVWKYPHVLLGALAIFFYVGAEVGNAGLLANYLQTLDIPSIDMTPELAAKFAAIYWGGAMVGRLFGAIMLLNIKSVSQKYTYVGAVLVLALISGAFVTEWNFEYGVYFLIIAVVNYLIMQLGKGNANRTLAVFAGVAASLGIISSLTGGSVALWTIVSIGFFNSVMFPNIFALAVKNLDGQEMSTASGIINSLIVGGAIIPLAMGKVADMAGYSWAFIIPALCYLYIAFYAIKGSKIGIKIS